MKFSPDGSQILSGSVDKTIRVWDSTQGKEILKPFHGHSGSISSIAVSSDGNRIASTSSDKTIRVWDAKAGVESLCLRVQNIHDDVTFFPDNIRIASCSRSDIRVYVWDAMSGGQLSTSAVHANVCCIALSPSGEQLAVGYDDLTIGLWNVTQLNQDVPPSQMPNDCIITLSFSPDGDRIASASKQDHTISIWDSHRGSKVLGPLQGHENTIHSLGYSPDGTLVASGSADSTICVWDMTSGIDTLSPL